MTTSPTVTMEKRPRHNRTGGEVKANPPRCDDAE
jgi:hypothetical protein